MNKLCGRSNSHENEMQAVLLKTASHYRFVLGNSAHKPEFWYEMFAGMVKKLVIIQTPAFFLPSLLISAYGVYAFIKRDFPTYMFLQSKFVFLDYDEPKILLYLDYISIMATCVFIGHYFYKLLDMSKNK